MVLAHLGVAVTLFGMAADSAFQTERLVAASPGETTQVGPYAVTFAGVLPVSGPNWTAVEAQLDASYKGGEAKRIGPQSRSFWSPPQETSEVAMLNRWNGQLYAAIGNEAESDGGATRWQLRLWWKPFVTWIWYGGLMIAAGGALALLGRLLADLRRRIAARKIAARRLDEQGVTA